MKSAVHIAASKRRLALLLAPLAAVCGLLGILVAGASGASVISASFTGGGVVLDGKRFAKGGDAMTLSVSTDANTECIQVTGAHTATQKSNQPRTTWTVALQANAAPGDHQVTVTAFRKAHPNQDHCNAQQGETYGTQTASYHVDSTGPVITATKVPAANVAGWNNSNVTVKWSATDAGAGVDASTIPADQAITAEGTTTRTATVKDRLGNASTASVDVRIDKAVDDIAGSRSPAANAHGWNNAPVTVSFLCSDARSGIAGCEPATKALTEDGAGQSVEGTATDNAGNTKTATVGAINIDRAAPALTGAATSAANEDGWHRDDVTIAWSASDPLSGIDPVTAPADGKVTGEGAGLKLSASVSDRAGNVRTADSASVNVDRTAPTTSAAAPTSWTNADATVTLTANDGLSGVKETRFRLDGGAVETGTSVAISDEGVHILEFWSVDRAGNAETAKSVEVKVDKTAPSITHSLSPAPNGLGWNRTRTEVTFECGDDRSGIASCGPNAVVAEDGEGQTRTGTATDNAGNRASRTASVSLDSTAPTITGAVDRDPNQHGWYADDVVVSFTCGDALSGVRLCTEPVTVAEGENGSAQGVARDAAGNEATDTVDGLDVDKTAPSLEGAPTTEANDAGWYRHDVVVTWKASDALSGLAGTAPGDDEVTGEGEDLSASATVTDRAGNQAAGTVDGINIDRTAPVTTAQFAAPLASGWYAESPAIELRAHDALSGVARTLYRVGDGEVQSYDGAFTLTGKGVHRVRFWSVDRAGNEEDRAGDANVVEVKVDGVAPRIEGTRLPAANAHGWNSSAVTVSFACADGESGIAHCDEPVQLEEEGAGQSASGRARDHAGNEASTKVEDVNIDLTPPTVRGQAIEPANDHGWHRDDVRVAWTIEDELSGPDAETTPETSVVTGEGPDLDVTSGFGRDRAGNAATGRLSGIRIDRTAPATKAQRPSPYATGWYDGAIQVALSATDDLSGIDAIRYAVDGGEVETYGDPIVIAQKGVHTLRFWGVDKAGNREDAQTVEVKIDGIKPTIGAGRTEASDANAHGWNNGDVVVEFTCEDAETAIRSCPPAYTFANEGAGQSTSGTAVDMAGNEETVTYGGVNIDRTEPTLVGLATTDPNAAGWHRSDVTIEWHASDALSGIDPATQPEPTNVTGEGAALSAGPVKVADKAGNETSAGVKGIKIDRTAPTVTGAPTAQPNGDGWHRGAVTVAFTCEDALSGVAGCPAPVVLDDNLAGQSASSGPVLDKAGNEAAGVTVGGINIDGLPPQTAADTRCTRVNDWCTGDEATVVLTATDQVGLSGVKAIAYRVNGGEEQVVAGQEASVRVPLIDEGEATISYGAVDYAGNAETRTAASLKWDNLAPAVKHTLSPTPNSAGWNRSDLTVGFVATDTGSGVKAGSVTEDVLVSDETDGRTIRGEAFDNAGNRGEDSVLVKLDRTAPAITGTVTGGTRGENGWYLSPVTVGFTCSDGLSGVASCEKPVTLTDNARGQSTTGAATDVAGNSASAKVEGIDIDAVKPQITLNGIAGGAIYTLGAVPTASCTASDDLSGPDGCTVKVTAGSANGVGTASYVATAKDRAGNVATEEGTFRVTYGWSGFKQPINDTAHQVATTTSVFKAGQTVPVKLELRNATGAVVQPNAAPKWLTPVKGGPTNAPVDEATYAASADSGLMYRLDSGQWIYNWGTAKAGAGSYWRIGVELDDGQRHYVNIGLR